MYAHPRHAAELKKKINTIVDQMSKLPRDSRKWAFLNMLARELHIMYATARMEKDHQALTYK